MTYSRRNISKKMVMDLLKKLQLSAKRITVENHRVWEVDDKWFLSLADVYGYFSKLENK